MPELPEVEVICKHLEKSIVGKEIIHIDTLLPRVWRNIDAKAVQPNLLDETIQAVRRRGKYIVILFESGLVLMVHLMMTGSLVYHPVDDGSDGYRISKHDRVLFHLRDGSLLVFGDVRTFGGLFLYPSIESIDHRGYCSLGVEPLSAEFGSDYLYKVAKSTSMQMKTFLLNQRYIAGLGNIYVDECLFKAGISPLLSANRLTKRKCTVLCEAIQSVLKESIERGGTTFRNYVNGEGKAGENQKYLHVYGRAGKNCHSCGKPLATETINSRRTVYCKHCQK